jgi:hypothetical protein
VAAWRAQARIGMVLPQVEIWFDSPRSDQMKGSWVCT